MRFQTRPLSSIMAHSFHFLLSSPPKGIQAPQPAVPQPAAAFGHHWVSSHTHIRQTVCWDGLRHLGWRRISSRRSHTSPLLLLLSHSFVPSTFSLRSTWHVSTLFLSMQYQVVLISHSDSQWEVKSVKDSSSVLTLNGPKFPLFMFSLSFIYFWEHRRKMSVRFLFCSVLTRTVKKCSCAALSCLFFFFKVACSDS